MEIFSTIQMLICPKFQVVLCNAAMNSVQNASCANEQRTQMRFSSRNVSLSRGREGETQAFTMTWHDATDAPILRTSMGNPIPKT